MLRHLFIHLLAPTRLSLEAPQKNSLDYNNRQRPHRQLLAASQPARAALCFCSQRSQTRPSGFICLEFTSRKRIRRSCNSCWSNEIFSEQITTWRSHNLAEGNKPEPSVKNREQKGKKRNWERSRWLQIWTDDSVISLCNWCDCCLPSPNLQPGRTGTRAPPHWSGFTCLQDSPTVNLPEC